MIDKNQDSNVQDGVTLTPEQERNRRARSVAIAVTIALMAVLFYAVTLVKLGGAVANRQI